MQFKNLYHLIGSLALATCASFCAASADAEEIQWGETPSVVLNEAHALGRPIVVYVTTQWCHFCKIMNEETWSDPSVQQLVNERFLTLTLDGDRDRELIEKIGITGYPSTLLYSPDGQYITHKSGHMSPGEALSWLTTTTALSSL